MMEQQQCNRLNKVAYKSCIDSYYQSNDKNDIYEYFLHLMHLKRHCEAEGVAKALELITLIEDLDAEAKKENSNKKL